MFATITPAALTVGLVEVTGPDGTDAGTAILWATDDVANALADLGYIADGPVTRDEDDRLTMNVRAA